MSLTVVLNGQSREFTELEAAAPLSELVRALGLQPDRVAVELNGSIVPRGRWVDTPLAPTDRLEVVHFVGGGTSRPFPLN